MLNKPSTIEALRFIFKMQMKIKQDSSHDLQGIPPPEALRYANEVRRRLGHHVKQVVLFGSRARGDASDASDYDFVVVLDSKEKAFREQIIDVGVMMLNATDRLFAALVYGPDEWSAIRSSPLGWNIQREGVLL